MKTLIWYQLSILIVLLAIGIEGQDFNKFGKTLFFDLTRKFPEQSVGAIPGPMYNTLGQMLCCSEGETFEALADSLGSRNCTDIKKRFKRSNDIILDSELNIRYSTKLYADDEYEFCPDFKQSYNKYFRGKTGNADFDNPKKAAKQINEWLDYEEVDQTGNPDLVNASVIKKDAGFILVSSVEIEVDYNTGYNPRKVKPTVFYSSPTVKKTVPALSGPAIVDYLFLKKYDSHFLGISLTGNFTLFIIYPREMDGLSNAVNAIENLVILEEVLPLQEKRCVDLTLPLGKLVAQYDFTDDVKKFRDLEIIFDKKRAEFTGITKNCKPGVMQAILSEIYFVDKMVEDNNYNEQTKPNLAEDVCDLDNLIKVDINHQFFFAIYNNAVGRFPPPVIIDGAYY